MRGLTSFVETPPEETPEEPPEEEIELAISVKRSGGTIEVELKQGEPIKVETSPRGSYEVVSIAYTDPEGNVIEEAAGSSAEFSYVKPGIIVVTAERKK